MAPIAVALLAAWLVPQLSAATLRALLLRRLPTEPERREERRGRLFGFRRAAFFVGIVQIQLAWMAGVRSVGPDLVAQPDAPLSYATGLLAALLAFVSGGVARAAIESPGVPARHAALLRLRIAPLFGGPLLAAIGARALPIVAGGRIHVGWALAAFAVVALGVAYGGLALSLLTFSLRPATPEIRAMARDVATREGTSVGLVLRLPTGGARLANAAALPWARAMVVTDHIVALLDPEALRAVLAHEAGHLSEKPLVALARLGAATVLIYSLVCGLHIALTTPPLNPHLLGAHAGSLIVRAHADALTPSALSFSWAPDWVSAVPVGVPVLAVVIGLALVSLVFVRRLARRMEERADAHAMATVGGLPLARALRAIGDDAEMPLVTSGKRVHPDLWDRLVALGDDPGPRPVGRSAKPAVRVGLLLAVVMAVAYGGGLFASGIDGDDAPHASPVRTQVALALDPWDGGAHLALAWGLRQRDDLGGAARELRRAAALGVADGPTEDLRAELLAAQGRCGEAAEAIDAATRARADGLQLREASLPPTYLTGCLR